MPLDKLFLILVIVIAAAAATLYLASIFAVSLEIPGGFLLLIPTALIAYIVVRVIRERVTNKEDDHYDNIEK
ncbi:hypothetical protein ACFE33_07740 [Falsihalocynthiibacter sp. SS001]|uniref:hypothetical protein n=1 Tax=Falsihalocynthiibacter sp. SS001 TaxID=3349698 RepID=UPI0036D40666